jgi:hypothetical protein
MEEMSRRNKIITGIAAVVFLITIICDVKGYSNGLEGHVVRISQIASLAVGIFHSRELGKKAKDKDNSSN